MRKSLLIAASVISVLLPTATLAAKTQTLEFGDGQLNASWQGKGPLQMTRTPGGILLQSTGTGTSLFITDTDLSITPDAGEIVASSERQVGVYFVWFFKDDPDQNSFSVGIDLAPGTDISTPFSLSEAKHWSGRPKEIALVLPPYTALLLHRIHLTEYNPLEKTLVAFQSFWTPDRYQPYTINFVWGPQIAVNPVQQRELYLALPPTSLSGTFVLYGVLLAGILVIAIFFLLSPVHEKKRRIVALSALWILALWGILDLRMGSEFLTWVAKDADSYITAPASVRTFRDRDRFYDFAAFATPYVFDRESYIFFAEQQWPYLGNMRYLSYPAIPGIAIDTDDTWVIYRRSDIEMGPDNRLMVDGMPISLPGKILGRFDDNSFVFRSDQKSIPASPAPL